MPRAAGLDDGLVGAAAVQRHRRPSVRQATVVFPSTGQRLKKRITLRDPSQTLTVDAEPSDLDPQRPLWRRCADFATSDQGKGVLKCSIAYLLASCAVFFPVFTKILGTGDGKHFVSNIVVWYHPSRSAGSMEQGTLYALTAFAFSGAVSAFGMGLATSFASQDQILIGHVLILLLCCGCGLGFLLWFKQQQKNMLVNVSVSLAAIPLVTLITKDDSIQQGYFSFEALGQTLRMAVMGIAISTLICVLLWPVRARRTLRRSIADTTDALADLVAGITASFLSGFEDDLTHPFVKAARDKMVANVAALDSVLGEARNERLLLGTEAVHHVEARLVECIQEISQDVGGLKSAAAMQFSLLSESPSTELFEVISQADEPQIDTSTTAGIFLLYINQLGPPMKSLAFTLKQILENLPFTDDFQVVNHPTFRSSLADALQLYDRSRKEALTSLYRNKQLMQARNEQVAADFEEVAASCGHFGFSLQGIGEHCLVYLDLLGELELADARERRSWWWLCFWRRSRRRELDAVVKEPRQHKEPDFQMPSLGVRRHNNLPPEERQKISHSLRYRLWTALSVFRQDDVRYAIKVGTGAALLAMLAFLPQTRDFFHRFRLEWALATYIIACSMTVGAANTTTIARLRGSLLGALLAVIIWIVTSNNAYALALCGWMVSYGCFYITIVKDQAPMGRFILLTYNLSVLYSHSLSLNDQDRDEDEGGIDPRIWEIVGHRLFAITIGCLWGLFITRTFWPIVARRKLRNGLSLLWLRMGLIWTKAPLSILLQPATDQRSDIRSELSLRKFSLTLETMRKNAENEFMLRGPFPSDDYKLLLESTGRMLDAIHALNVVITKDLKATPGEAALLRATEAERQQLAKRISHLLSVLASSMQLEYPLNDVLPDISHTRDRLLAKIFALRGRPQDLFETDAADVKDEDYELLYTYALVTGQIAKEINVSSKLVEKLFGTLDEHLLKLQ